MPAGIQVFQKVFQQMDLQHNKHTHCWFYLCNIVTLLVGYTDVISCHPPSWLHLPGEEPSALVQRQGERGQPGQVSIKSFQHSRHFHHPEILPLFKYDLRLGMSSRRRFHADTRGGLSYTITTRWAGREQFCQRTFRFVCDIFS